MSLLSAENDLGLYPKLESARVGEENLIRRNPPHKRGRNAPVRLFHLYKIACDKLPLLQKLQCLNIKT